MPRNTAQQQHVPPLRHSGSPPGAAANSASDDIVLTLPFGPPTFSRSTPFALAAVAHELCDPLLSVRAAIEAVAQMDPMVADNRLLARASADLEGLAESVVSLLALAPRSELDVAPSSVNMNEVARDAADSCELLGGAGRVRVFSSSRPIPVHADARHLRTAISNLVRNALEHSPAGSVVTVRVGSSAETATVTVTNPIAVTPLPSNGALPLAAGGAVPPRPRGLGLLIARVLVEEYGGELVIMRRARSWTTSIRMPAVVEQSPFVEQSAFTDSIAGAAS